MTIRQYSEKLRQIINGLIPLRKKTVQNERYPVPRDRKEWLYGRARKNFKKLSISDERREELIEKIRNADKEIMKFHRRQQRTNEECNKNVKEPKVFFSKTRILRTDPFKMQKSTKMTPRKYARHNWLIQISIKLKKQWEDRWGAV